MKTPTSTSAAAPASKEARQVAAAILEVLAGARTPQEAAVALGWSLPRYYQVEARALRGLVAACAPAPRGPRRSVDAELERLRREQAQLRRQLQRQQALVRLTQRHGGLPPVAPKPSGRKTRKRKTARALTAAARLRREEPAADAGTPPAS
jgi:hypothetical protein